MKVFTIAGKTLKELVRQPRTLALSLGLPVAFMLIFGLAFGESSPTTYKVAVLDEDEGDVGAAYAEGLGNLTYSNGQAIIAVTPVESEDAARDGLASRAFDLFVRIPANFSASVTPTVEEGPPSPLPVQQAPPRVTPPSGATVEMTGDPGSPKFNIASQIVDGYTQAFSEAASKQKPLVRTETKFVRETEITGFDVIAPGLMVFAILNLAPQSAAVLARETELRTLDRVRLSPVRSWQLLAGVGLAELAFASVSLALMLATARLMGFHNEGSYAAAYAIALGAAVAVVGVGLMIASFAKSQQEASNLGILVSVPASFLSGSFFAIPGVTLFTLGGRTVELYDVLPTTHAVDAMRSVMTYGNAASAVSGSLLAMAALAFVYYVAGVVLFRRNRLAPE